MGSTNTEPGRDSDEGPQHVVHLTKDFWIGAHPVTQAQYAALGFENFSKFPGPNHPVEMLDLAEMNRFLDRLSEKEDIRYRLPTEAQWEYACRGGTESPWFFGSDVSALRDFAWYTENSQGTTHPVGLKKPNPFGLYDILGNVWERCSDKWDQRGYFPHVMVDPFNEGPCSPNIRGGCYYSDAAILRSAKRFGYGAPQRFFSLGFRVIFHADDEVSSGLASQKRRSTAKND